MNAHPKSPLPGRIVERPARSPLADERPSANTLPSPHNELASSASRQTRANQPKPTAIHKTPPLQRSLITCIVVRVFRGASKGILHGEDLAECIVRVRRDSIEVIGASEHIAEIVVRELRRMSAGIRDGSLVVIGVIGVSGGIPLGVGLRENVANGIVRVGELTEACRAVPPFFSSRAEEIVVLEGRLAAIAIDLLDEIAPDVVRERLVVAEGISPFGQAISIVVLEGRRLVERVGVARLIADGVVVVADDLIERVGFLDQAIEVVVLVCERCNGGVWEKQEPMTTGVDGG
ncbi:hypothetical protein Pan216_11250 [Planctomycetes bacterium Pan216]|uniref:Uncharacterized protein n=1 Tax=Kolteria novifilia TaxID=2527975 RepID=A0A518AZZ0_9BACT|nr:hypothetical protein Pan216_11250 [Planctomycetes bacterium Pan216]